MSDDTTLVDLAAERFGGRALLTNDDFFAPMANLLKPGRGVFIEDKYTDRGKWMDGWESRRRREPGNDWCIIRLGMSGTIQRVVVDTNHFRGNHPDGCALEACCVEGDPSGEVLAESDDLWTEVLGRQHLEGHSENVFDIGDARRFTHVRLQIFPDGGVARLRILGHVTPDWAALSDAAEPINLLGVENGGLPVVCSDQFFSEPLNLLRPDLAETMGDGWETRRRRGPGHDWAVLQLGHRGTIEHLELDTRHFKGNYPESCSIEGCDAPDATSTALQGDSVEWFEVVPPTKLQPDHQHRFELSAEAVRTATHLRLNMFPDGGISRLRAFGRPSLADEPR